MGLNLIICHAVAFIGHIVVAQKYAIRLTIVVSWNTSTTSWHMVSSKISSSTLDNHNLNQFGTRVLQLWCRTALSIYIIYCIMFTRRLAIITIDVPLITFWNIILGLNWNYCWIRCLSP